MTTQHDNPPRRRAGRRILHVSLIVVLGLPLGLYTKARVQWAWRVDRQIQAIKAQGLPTTQAELVAWYRLKSGSLPTDANALVPEYLASVPLDPFTGEPVKYRQLAKGYVVYSVGNDLSDDAGKERPIRRQNEPPATYDITFIVER